MSLGLGAGFGVHAISKFDESKQACDGNECLPAGEQALWDARSAGDAATACMIAGWALLVSGVVLYLTVPSESHEAPSDAGGRRSSAPGAANGPDVSMQLGISAGPGMALLGWDGQF